MSNAIIEVQGVIKDYPLGKLKVRALHRVSPGMAGCCNGSRGAISPSRTWI